MPLQAISEVMQHFNEYMDIPQIKELSDKVYNRFHTISRDNKTNILINKSKFLLRYNKFMLS